MPAEHSGTQFELYKLAVEMADRISARRGVANSFFLTVNTGIVTLVASNDFRWYVPVAGLVFAATWWALLRSYRELNRAKFAVILAMEQSLPARIYADEWDHLRSEPVRFALRLDSVRSWVAQYQERGRIERLVPWVFAVIYAAELLRQAAT
jgi:hypothetical protein